MSSLAALRREIQALADPKNAECLQRFFKTAAGDYGHGDQFLGIRVPPLRAIVQRASGSPTLSGSSISVSR